MTLYNNITTTLFPTLLNIQHSQQQLQHNIQQQTTEIDARIVKLTDILENEQSGVYTLISKSTLNYNSIISRLSNTQLMIVITTLIQEFLQQLQVFEGLLSEKKYVEAVTMLVQLVNLCFFYIEFACFEYNFHSVNTFVFGSCSLLVALSTTKPLHTSSNTTHFTIPPKFTN